eukprot:scaffold37635_cov33-Attheya_sp.AAC.1
MGAFCHVEVKDGASLHIIEVYKGRLKELNRGKIMSLEKSAAFHHRDFVFISTHLVSALTRQESA